MGSAKRYLGKATMKNLLDILFGPKVHTYEELETHAETVYLSSVPGDTRQVRFVLKAIWKGRQRGPQRARRKEFVGYLTHWHTPYGIPIKNTSNGEKVIKSADFETHELMVDTGYWKVDVVYHLEQQIREIREANGYYFEGLKLRANNE